MSVGGELVRAIVASDRDGRRAAHGARGARRRLAADRRPAEVGRRPVRGGRRRRQRRITPAGRAGGVRVPGRHRRAVRRGRPRPGGPRMIAPAAPVRLAAGLSTKRDGDEGAETSRAPGPFRRTWTRPCLICRPLRRARARPRPAPARAGAGAASRGAGGALPDRLRRRTATTLPRTDAPAAGAPPPPTARRRPPSRPLVAPWSPPRKVPVNGGVILDKQRIVVTQPAEGHVQGVHRGVHPRGRASSGASRTARHQLPLPRLRVQRHRRVGEERPGHPAAWPRSRSPSRAARSSRPEPAAPRRARRPGRS